MTLPETAAREVPSVGGGGGGGSGQCAGGRNVGGSGGSVGYLSLPHLAAGGVDGPRSAEGPAAAHRERVPGARRRVNVPGQAGYAWHRQ